MNTNQRHHRVWKLLAGAGRPFVASCLIAGASGTQAAPSVTLYGLLDASLAHTRYTFDQAGEYVRNERGDVRSGIIDTSRFGIRGREDIGNGLRVLFQLEQAVDLADGTAGNWRRQSWAGLRGAWGTLTLGRQKDVADAMFKVDTIRGLGKSKRAFGGKGRRHDNLLKYISPDFAGVRGGIAYASREGSDENGRLWSLGAQYRGGPLIFGGGYNIEREPDGYDVTNWALGGSYDFRTWKLTAGYGRDRNGKFNAPGDVESATLAGFKPTGWRDYNMEGFKSRNTYLGAVLPIGRGELSLAWSRSASNLHRVAPRAQRKTQEIVAGGYEWSLSRRTALYVYGAYATGLTYLDGFAGTEFAAGMRHTF